MKALEQNDENNPWMDIKTAPWMEVIEVANQLMDKPVRATRGYVSNGVVNPDKNLFTTVYTPDDIFPVPSGNLCCPTKWRKLIEAASK